MKLLADAFNTMGRNLKAHIVELKKTTAEKERMLKEMEIAHNIQQRLISAVAPVIAEMDIAFDNLPWREVGGDFYDFIPVGENAWGFAISDISGKGMPAAFL